MSTITSLVGSTPVTTAGAATIINTNFSNLNTDKIETSYLDTDNTLAADSDSKIATQKATKAYVDAGGTPSITAIRVLPYIFPIGAIYTATVSTNPATLLGFGTWSAFGSGRVLVGAGTGTVTATFASRASNVITVTGLTNASNNEFQTGQAVLYHSTGSVITGLTDNTTYYLIRTGNLTFSLASSLANAQNGTVISLSSDGSGVQTFVLTLTARTGGDTGGEENHAMSSSELLAHAHTGSSVSEASGSGGTENGYSKNGTGGPNNGNYASHWLSISSSGGNSAMNNMQPFVTVYMWQRTA